MKYHTRQMKNTTTHKNWYKIEEQKVRGKNPQILKEGTNEERHSILKRPNQERLNPNEIGKPNKSLIE